MGLPSPFRFVWLKMARFFFDKEINTVGSEGIQSFYYNERRANTTVRDIKTLVLPPGRYSAVITTLEDVPAFNGIESFVEFTYYNPKI